MKASHTIVLAAILGLSACAPTVWYRPGSTQADFEQTKATCEYQAQLATPDVYTPTLGDAIGAGIAAGIREGTLENECMRASGWQPMHPHTGPNFTVTSEAAP